MIAATLVYNTSDLVSQMRGQIEDIWIVDNGSTPRIRDAAFRLNENRMFTGGWKTFMDWVALNPAIKWVWMLNSDVTGVDKDMGRVLSEWGEEFDAGIVTPAFNSPHGIFHNQNAGLRQVSWIDWCVPMVNMDFWRDTGGFDPQFKGYGADIDLCYRGRQKGWKYHVCDWYTVNHAGSMTALRHGLQGEQGDLGEMDRLLFLKHGRHWNELI